MGAERRVGLAGGDGLSWGVRFCAESLGLMSARHSAATRRSQRSVNGLPLACVATVSPVSPSVARPVRTITGSEVGGQHWGGGTTTHDAHSELREGNGTRRGRRAARWRRLAARSLQPKASQSTQRGTRTIYQITHHSDHERRLLALPCACSACRKNACGLRKIGLFSCSAATVPIVVSRCC